MTHISSGSGVPGLVLPTSGLTVNHNGTLVLNADNSLSDTFKVADKSSNEPWATDDGSGNILAKSGLYAYWMGFGYDICTHDCNFSVSVYGNSDDLLTLSTQIFVPANTQLFLTATGLSLFVGQQTFTWQLSASNAVDPTFTITSISLFMAKVA